MKYYEDIDLFGLGGDPLHAPSNTLPAFWASLAAGAAGIVCNIQMSKDEVLFCADHHFFEDKGKGKVNFSDFTWDEILKLDAGENYRSIELDENDTPTGSFGNDNPWKAKRESQRLRFVSLAQVLSLFSRRCKVILKIEGERSLEVCKRVAYLITDLNIERRVNIMAVADTIKQVSSEYPRMRYTLISEEAKTPIQNIADALELKVESVFFNVEYCFSKTPMGPKIGDQILVLIQKYNIQIYLGTSGPRATVNILYLNSEIPFTLIAGVIVRGVIPMANRLAPRGLVVSDDFQGKSINRKIWTGGYSTRNQETKIYQSDGFHVEIQKGTQYSGGALVCQLPLHGRFDTMVDYEVTNPQKGTTFELAAICIDPGYFRIDNSDLDSRQVHLSFDVHGAPPYASSERDEDDGFRCGWNNSFNLTRVSDDWVSSSVNMYNKYGRNVGDSTEKSQKGTLRLIRNGPVFASFYRDLNNVAWVCSGVMLVQNMSEDCFIRIAAKHWPKGGNPAPENHVRFNNFKIHQF